MTSESNPLSDKQVKVTIFVCALICLVVAYFFSMYETTGSFGFVPLPHGDTGEPLSVFNSLAVYFFQFFISATVCSSIIACLAFFYSNILEKGNSIKFVSSKLNHFSISISYILTPIVIGALFFLKMFGIITAK